MGTDFFCFIVATMLQKRFSFSLNGKSNYVYLYSINIFLGLWQDLKHGLITWKVIMKFRIFWTYFNNSWNLVLEVLDSPMLVNKQIGSMFHATFVMSYISYKNRIVVF